MEQTQKKMVSHEKVKDWALELIELLGLTNPDIDTYYRWKDLLQILITVDSLDDQRSSKHFKWAVQLVIYIKDTILEVRGAMNRPHADETLTWLGVQLLEDPDNVRPMEILIAAIDDVEDPHYWGMDSNDFKVLRKDLGHVLRYLKSLHDLD